eukprot:88402-Prymnesium_polylepis.2
MIVGPVSCAGRPSVAWQAGTWCSGELPADNAAAVPPEYRRHQLRALSHAARHPLGRAVCIGGGLQTAEALNGSLARLGVARLDLHLLHWPLSHAAYDMDDERHAQVRHPSPAKPHLYPALTTLYRPHWPRP